MLPRPGSAPSHSWCWCWPRCFPSAWASCCWRSWSRRPTGRRTGSRCWARWRRCSSAAAAGLFASLKTLAASLIGIVQTRLELLSTDVAEARERTIALLVLVLAALFSLGVGVVLLAILVAAAYWETHRLAVLGALAALFLGGGGRAVRFPENAGGEPDRHRPDPPRAAVHRCCRGPGAHHRTPGAGAGRAVFPRRGRRAAGDPGRGGLLGDAPARGAGRVGGAVPRRR